MVFLFFFFFLYIYFFLWLRGRFKTSSWMPTSRPNALASSVLGERGSSPDIPKSEGLATWKDKNSAPITDTSIGALGTFFWTCQEIALTLTLDYSCRSPLVGKIPSFNFTGLKFHTFITPINNYIDGWNDFQCLFQRTTVVIFIF